MALSGSAYTSFKDHQLIIEWSATQNIPQNKSTVVARVYLKGTKTWSTIYGGAQNKGTVTVNGSTQSFTATSSITGTQKKLLTTKTFTVSHNSNGTKSFNFSTTYNINVNYNGWVYNQTASGNGTLDTIPRTSGVTVITPNITFGSDLQFKINTPVSGFTYQAEADVGGESIADVYPGASAGGTKRLNIPLSILYGSPSTSQLVGTLTIVTLSGRNIIGSSSASFRVSVPTTGGSGGTSAIAPSITGTKITEDNYKVTTLLGSASGSTFIQGISRIGYQIDATPNAGASLSSFSASLGDTTVMGQRGIIDLSRTPSTLGDNKITFTVTDTRNQKVTVEPTISVLPYGAPSITSFGATRTNSGKGSSVIVSMSGNVAPVIPNSTNLNTYTTTVFYRQAGISTWSTGANLGNSIKNVTINNIRPDHGYEFKVVVSDKLSESTAEVSVPTASTLFHLNKDIGVGIGSMHEKGVLDVEGDSYFDGRLFLNGRTEINGPTDVKGSMVIGGNTKIDGATTLNGTLDVTKNVNMGREGQLTVAPNRFARIGTTPALNMNNSDIAGLNGIFFGRLGERDPSDNISEGILFPKSNTYISPTGEFSNVEEEWNSFRIVDGVAYIDNMPIGMHTISDPLWTGSLYPLGMHTLQISRSIYQCPSGWALLWAQYRNGSAQTFGYSWTFIHKHQAALNSTFYCTMPSYSGAENIRTKTMEMKSTTTLRGTDDNNKGGAENLVLVGVYPW